MYELEKSEIEKQLETATDFFEKMDLLGRLYELDIKYGIKNRSNPDQPIECVGCGS